ncbi:hypothetical protein AUP68_09338 [Ilyonectria robusta]
MDSKIGLSRPVWPLALARVVRSTGSLPATNVAKSLCSCAILDVTKGNDNLPDDIILETPCEFSQRHSSQDTSEGQGLATIDASESSSITDDATHISTPIPLSQSTPDPPTPARMWQPLPAPLNTDDALCLGQDHEASSRDSEDAKTHTLSQGALQSSSGARVSPFRPLGPTTRYYTRRQAVHRLVQNNNNSSSNTGSESQGSEFHLGRANLQHNKDYCPSDTEVEEIGLGDESDGEDQYPRKRRKVSRSSASLLRDETASVERPRRRRPSLRSRSIQLTYRGKYMQASGILSPVLSQAISNKTEVRAVLTSFKK